jgi:hypothetical protein
MSFVPPRGEPTLVAVLTATLVSLEGRESVSD